MNIRPGYSFRSLVIALAAVATVTGCTASIAPSEPPRPTSEVEASRLFYECMLDRGWDVHLEANGTSIDLRNEQVELYQKDSSECSQQTNPAQELSREQWAEAYELQLEEARCLEREFGYPYDPPSLQEFLDTATTEQQWAPFAEMVNSGFAVPGGYAAASKTCPQPWYNG